MGQTIDGKSVFRVELHVHTPSSNCYKGPKTEEEYLKIIETAYEKKIDILAITDHNSVKGFYIIQALKQRVRNEYSALVAIGDSKEAKAKTKQLKSILSFFDSVFLLPGVEFEVNNGIHLLVLFNPDTPESTIERFLHEGGFDDRTYGKENDVFSCWSIFDLYRESKKYDCVVIDAHSDSNKGIFNTLEGQPRVHAFIDSCLSGICYKSEKQKNSIETLMSQYSRKTPVAFLKSSDAHQLSEVGRDVSFFRIREVSWESFKDAFSNPTECIFTTYPHTHSILNKVASSGSCFFISQLNEDSCHLLSQYVCGLANADGGHIIVGADSISSINGMPVEYLGEIKNMLLRVYESIPGLANISVNQYPIKDNSVVLVIRVAQSEELLSIDGDSYIYCCQNKKNKILDAAEIQSLITLRLTSHFSEKIDSELDTIRKKTTAIDTFIKSLPVLNSFYNNSIFLTSVVISVDTIASAHMSAQQFASIKDNFERHPNGISRGNTLFFEGEQKPRLSDAYLRISVPRFIVNGLSPSEDGSVLYFIPGGAVYYSEKSLNCSYNTREPVLKVRINKDYPIKFLCSYLKSSFYLWYIMNRFNTFDVIPPSSFNCVRIPQIHIKNPKELAIVSEVETLFDSIIAAEKSFLVKQGKIKQSDELLEVTIAHNNSVKESFIRIDELFFILMGISDTEKNIILENLKVNGVYIPE